MHSEASQWVISETRWNLDLDVALWFREYLSIETLKPEQIPGRLVPPVSTKVGYSPSPELQQGWESWWTSLVASPADDEPGGPGGYARDEFAALGDWPALRTLVLDNFAAANVWHSERKRSAVSMFQTDPKLMDVLHDIEESAGRRLHPFRLELFLVPVQNPDVCEVVPGRFLMSEFHRDAFVDSEQFREAILALGSR